MVEMAATNAVQEKTSGEKMAIILHRKNILAEHDRFSYVAFYN